MHRKCEGINQWAMVARRGAQGPRRIACAYAVDSVGVAHRLQNQVKPVQTFIDFVMPRVRDAAGLCINLGPREPTQTQFSPDGRLWLIRGQDGNWTLHLVTEGQVTSHDLPSAFAAAQSVQFSADSQLALVHLGSREVVLWDIYGLSAQDGASSFYTLGFKDMPTTACTFLSHKHDVLLGLQNGTVCVLPALDAGEQGAPLGQGFFQHAHAVTAVAHTPATGQTASCDASGRVALFGRDLSPDSVRAHHLHEGAVAHALFSPSGDHLVTGDQDGRVVIAHAAGAHPPSTEDEQGGDLACVQFDHFDRPVTGLNFSPDGRWLIVTHAQAGLTLCDFFAGAESNQFVAQAVSFNNQMQPNVAFSPDSRFVALQDGPSMALMFEPPHMDIEAGAWVVGEGGMATCMAVLPKEDVLAACDPQGVWRLSRFGQVFTDGRAEMVRQIAVARMKKAATTKR